MLAQTPARPPQPTCLTYCPSVQRVVLVQLVEECEVWLWYVSVAQAWYCRSLLAVGAAADVRVKQK